MPVLEIREGASNEGYERWNNQTTRIWDRKVEGGFPGMWRRQPDLRLKMQMGSERRFFNCLCRPPPFFAQTHPRLLSCVRLVRPNSRISCPNPKTCQLRSFKSHTNSFFLNLETKILKRLVRDIIDPSRDLGHVDRLKAPSPASQNPTVPEESSCGGTVRFQDEILSQAMITTPTVTTTQVARQEDNNKNNECTKPWGNEAGEQGGPLPTEVEIESGLLVGFSELPQHQPEQEQKKNCNRVICEDCT